MLTDVPYIVVFLISLMLGHNDSDTSRNYACDEGFLLERTENGLRLSGRMQTPTPGYSSEIIVHGDGNVSLRIYSPKTGAMIQMIDTFDFSHVFDVPMDKEKLVISIDKDFAWGPDSVTCVSK